MKSILTILICLLTLGVFAQTGSKSTAPQAVKKAPTCYDTWYSLFKERGADPIPDGTHEVIISLRNEYDYAECFIGKIDVKDNKMVSKLHIQKVDGSFEEFDKKANSIYLNADGVIKDELRGITNGMSESLTLSDGEKIRLFFYKSISPKQKANKKAPDPSALIKN